MRKRLLLLFCNLWVLASLAQPGKEAWHWVFGQTGLDFSSGSPVFFQGSTGYIRAACASISDPNTGQYLFYTTGVVVGNANVNLMTGGVGLLGNQWTTQTLIVPHPGHKNLYFIITADALGGANGVRYSVVDMAQLNGLGKVTIKNKMLSPAPMTEKLTAVRHCNGKDYWIITHAYNSDAFKVFLVDQAGIDTVPVVSHVGTAHQYIAPYNDEAQGYMKASPDGSRIALGITSDSVPLLEILNIDNSSGQVSNPISITFPGADGPYGLSFSPDNSKVYACIYPGDTICSIYQFDLSSGTPAGITSSATLLGQTKWYSMVNSPQTGMVSAMQMGPDGKIYIARESLDTLAVINNPNNSGLACNFSWLGVVMGPPQWNWALNGLPNFIDANYAGIQINIPDVQQCNTFTATTLDPGPGFANYFWSTGASTQTISVTMPGKYWVTVTNSQGCIRTDTVNAYLLNSMKIDTVACDTFHANITQNGTVHYAWFDSSHVPIRDFTQNGNYYADISFGGGCAVRDSLNITVVPSPQIDLGEDTAFCKGNLAMDASCNICSYQWSTGERTSVIKAESPGTYWVEVRDVNGCAGSDTLVVKPQPDAFDFVMPNIVTPNGDNINDEIDFGKYQFSTFNIEVYNRWGLKVFSIDEASAIWRPTGDEGTYFYSGAYKIDCGVESKSGNIKGFITVVR